MDEAFIVVIPARLASTRLPNKPLADIAGKPMVVQVALQAAKSRAQKIIVAADHQSIVDACEKYNIPAVLTSEQHPSGTDRLAEVAQLLNLTDDQIVVNVQGDEPLIDPELIDQLAATLVQSNTPVATSANPIAEVEQLFDPNVVKVVLNKKSEALYFSRAPVPWDRDQFAQDRNILPTKLPILRHIGIYAYRASFLKTYKQLKPSLLEQSESLEQLRVLWHGEKIAVNITDTSPAIGVDTPDDLARVNEIFSKQDSI